MIRKLRIKFILITMILVNLVMIIAFSSICFFSYQWMKEESYKAMERMANNKNGPPPLEIGKRGPQKAEPMIPIFSVLLDENTEIISVSRENVTISDETIVAITQAVLDSGKHKGILFDMHLRFLTKETPDGLKIVFANMGREIDSITNLVSTLLLVGFGGLAALFFISLYLSKWALKPVERAWEQQHQFMADASHELKTPLTVILANTGILLSHRKDTIEQQAKWIENTETEANRMKKLVEDLLFLAKSDGPSEPTMGQSQLNFSDIVWSTLLPFESLAYEQGVVINNEIASDITLVGNEGQLKQLVVILLDNGCKYAGDHGTVTLTMGRKQDHVQLSVNNTGHSIPDEHLKHIFKRFYRSDSSRARSQGGYGLGLSIAVAIVKNHGGKISVKSNKEEGTTFTVLFPINYLK